MIYMYILFVGFAFEFLVFFFFFVWKRSKLGAQFGSKCVENGVILLLLYYTIMGQLQLV